MNLFTLIVAGGQGSRMNSAIPKQFLELNGKPILQHTMEAFSRFDNDIRIVLVLPKDQISHWQKMVKVYDIKINHETVAGGDNRFTSVKNGLDAINEEGLVAIHDGVRPLVSGEIIHSGFQLASEKGNAITAVDLKDSIRQVTGEKSTTVNREDYKIIQTPQTFEVSLIKKAYESARHSNFTDDASVIEKYGEPVHLIDGSYSNIKITTQEDLIIASSLISEV